MTNNHRILILLIILGLTIRLLLLQLPGFKIDVDSWFAWAIRLNTVGFSQFYSPQVFSDYTPGYMYILGLLGFLKNLLGIDAHTFYLLLKLPAIFAEVILAVLIFKQTTLLGAFLILINPALIFNSSIWGQVDAVVTLAMFLALYFLKKNLLVTSSIFAGIALLIKPQAIAIAPVFLLFSLKYFSLKNIVKLTLPFCLILYVFSWPFFNNNTIVNLTGLITKTAGEYPFTSLFADNFWGMVGFWINDSTLWNGLSYQIWGYILLASYWIIISYFYFKKRLSVFSLATLATLSFFFLPTRVHERYLYPALVFLTILAAIYKSKIVLLLTGTLSVIHFINLYFVYVYYNELYLKLPKTLYHPALYNFAFSNSTILSAVSTIIFIILTIFIIKYDTKFNKN